MPAHSAQTGPMAAASDLLRRAEAKRAKRRFEQAEQLYLQALAAEPANDVALFGLGTVVALQGRHGDAVPRLATALKLDPGRAERWFGLAEVLVATGRLAETRALLERFVAQALPDAEIAALKTRFVTTLLARALRSQEAKRGAEAEALYDIVLLLDATNANALHLAGGAALDAGRLDLAAHLAELAIAQDPSAAAFRDALGQARHRQGRLDEALAAFAHAADLDPADAQHLNNQASTLQDLGRFAEAETLLRRAIRLKPDYALAWNNLGLALAELGRLPDAIAAYRQAVALKPTYAAALCHLGLALGRSGDGAGAEARYRDAIRIDPDHAFARNNLGNLLRDTGRAEEALIQLRVARRLRPDVADIHSNLGTTLMGLDRLDEAKVCLLEAVRLAPADPNLRYNLGNLYAREFRFRLALDEYAKAIELKSDFVEAMNNVADAYRIMTLLDDAERVLRRAIECRPDYVAAHNNLGNLLRGLERYEEAAASFERAVALDPGQAETHVNLAMTYTDLGRREDALAACQAASQARNNIGSDADKEELRSTLIHLSDLASGPAVPGIRGLRTMAAYSNALFQRLYRADVTPEEQAADARHFGERFADPLLRRRPFPNDADPERRLRIGFVSADFRQHSVNYFFEPVLRHLDRTQFETFAYSNTILVDDTADRLRGTFDHWRCIRRMADEAATDLIEADGIDILVDLSGHTAGNRLGIFARKPAPVQFTWIGYPGTVGMKAIDYRFADATEPEGEGERLSVETLWRLPRLCFCYQANPLCPDPVAQAPFERNGHVTFGCFNNYAKLTDTVLTTWRQILDAVPGSRLLLELANIEQAKIRGDILARFERLGLPLDRIDLEPRTPENRFVLYNRIDIALDPFPYNGGTTSLDTLYMGVPFVALEGGHLVARLGYGMLAAIGMPELAARSIEDYVRVASGLALDPARLRSLREGLRDRMVASTLMDHAGLGRMVGDAFRGMWRRWAEPRAQ